MRCLWGTRVLSFFAILWACAPFDIFALDPNRAITQYVLRTWRTEDGLPQISATAIAQTNDGYIWIGTRDGLARFDGTRFVVYDKENTRGLHDNEIQTLITDRRGTLWIGTVGGLSAYSAGHFRAFTAVDGIPAQRIESLFVSRDGMLWVGCASAAYTNESGTFRVHPLPLSGNVLSMTEGEQAMWFGMNTGLVRVAGASLRVFTTKDGLPDNRVNAVANVDDRIWLGTEHGVAWWSRGSFHRDGVPEELRSPEVWAIQSDSDRLLWFATRQGLMRLRRNKVDVLTTAGGLSNDYVGALFEDRERSLWVGTEHGGINQLFNGAITTWTTNEGLPANTIWSIFDDHYGNVWVGTEKGLARITHGRVSAISSALLPRSATVCAIAQTRDSALWFGTYESGVVRLRNGQWSRFTKADGLAGNLVTSLDVDGDDVWVGGADGVSRITHDRATTLKVDGIPSDAINAIHRDRRGRIWLATWKGIVWAGANNRAQASLGGTPLPTAAAFCIHEERDGTLWIGTHAGLLQVSTSNRVTLLTSRDGLPKSEVRHIEQDARGDFWLACSRGAYRVGEREMKTLRIKEAMLLPDGIRKGGEITY